VFDNAGNRIPFSTRGRIIAHCAARTACPHFGLLVGQQAGLQSFGMVGLLMKSAPDVGTAVRGLVRHFHLHVCGATMALEVHGDLAVLRYEIYQPRVEGTEQVSAGAVAVAFNVMRQLVGSDWRPIEVRFAHRKPEDVKPFRQFFGVPLRFDAKEYAVVFSATRLARGMPDTDPELRRLVQEQIDKLERLHGDDFPEQVRSVLRHALVAGDATADRIAAVFSMQRRTLHRRLNAFGTCFQTVADEVSFAIARQLLEGSGLDFGRIAAALDYANASAFTRAFRRWSGTTPAQWRTTATGAVQDTGRESAGRAAHSRNEKRQPAPSERR
jgi:AraC-like DNA-binding protein